MTNEIVISPILDKKFNSHPSDSEIWKKAYKLEELTDKVRGMHSAWYEYTIRFRNTVPIQCVKMREI